jgi:hypothetical protein
MKNLFYNLGYLSFIALLYIPTQDVGFLGFLGFLPYFAVFNMDDERLEANIGKATKNAFAFTIVAGVALVLYAAAFTVTESLWAIAFTSLWAGNVIIAVSSLIYYERQSQ